MSDDPMSLVGSTPDVVVIGDRATCSDCGAAVVVRSTIPNVSLTTRCSCGTVYEVVL
jgi:hypothetical protein